MYKKIIFACVMLFSMIFAENNENSNAFNKYMSPEGGINPMSGTVALGKQIASIADGEVSVSFDLRYSGNIFKEVRTRNDQSSVGIVGLGWSLGRAKIVSDNRGTSFLGDDQYYLMLASGSRYKIFKAKLPNLSDSKWWVEGHPYMKVEQIVDSTDVTGNGKMVYYVKGWKITDTKGIVHIYGDIEDSSNSILFRPLRNATEFDLFWPTQGGTLFGYGLVGKAIGGSPHLYPTIWNISKEEDVEGNFLQYTYEQITESLSGTFEKGRSWTSGLKYTKEVYLKLVYSSKRDSIFFEYGNKGNGDFLGEYIDKEGKRNEQLNDSLSDMSIEKVNRKFLSNIQIHSKEGKIGSVELCYTPLIQKEIDGTEKDDYVKRLLSAVRFFNKNGDEVDYERYEYYTDSKKASAEENEISYPLGALYKVFGKECGWVKYSYMRESLGRGHAEVLDADSIFGMGFLEDGTSYLVGRKTYNMIVVFHRINGAWKSIDTIQTKHVEGIEFGDAGWFLIKDKYSDDIVASTVYQWNSKKWDEVYSDYAKGSNFSLLDAGDVDVMNIYAGPDYIVKVSIRGSFFKSKANVEIVWSKWGSRIDIVKDFENVEIERDAIRVIPRRNHILLQINTTDWSNAIELHIYTFNSRGEVQRSFKEDGLDNGNMYYLDDDYFVEIAEPSAYYGGYSRFRARVWNGYEWVTEKTEFFSSDNLYSEMDLQAHGRNYYTIRHHGKRYMTNFYWDGEEWIIPNGQNRVQIQDYAWYSDAWKWAGFGGDDFFVVGQSRLDCNMLVWCDVTKYAALHLYYLNKNQNNTWMYENIGHLGDEIKEKRVITGDGWFLEKSMGQARIWNGVGWKQEDLRYIYNVNKAYSLGREFFAVPLGDSTKIYYKVGDSFNGEYKTYSVYKKEIFEPVVDKIIEYTYVFSKEHNDIAYDESLNTPLFKKMTVILPSEQGSLVSELCSGEYKNGDGIYEYNVGLGDVCIETQYGKTHSAGVGKASVITRRQIQYERFRDTIWPNNVYLDRIGKETLFNRTIKSEKKYEYSKNNGLLVSIKKKIGSKKTEEVTSYVVDLKTSIEDYEARLGNANRIDAVAGAYSCLGYCENGRIVSANANGWKNVDSLFRPVSVWKMTPTARTTKSVVESDIAAIVNAGDKESHPNWKRSSYNSVFQNNDVIETIEGPNKVKIASFKNPDTRRLYGTAANCGVDEGLMLSGEYCGLINDVAWSGCVLSENMDSVSGYAINGNRGSQYGRFSNKVLKLAGGSTLSATIRKSLNKKYIASAWIQSFGSDSVNINVSLGSYSQSKKILTNGGWQKIEFEVQKQSSGPIAFSLRNESTSEIRMQDVRVLPYDATSSALYWNEKWDKIQTTVDNRGVGSYVRYDTLGREFEHFLETDDGKVYLSSRTTYADGKCKVNANGDDKLAEIVVNGKKYVNPSSQKILNLDAVNVDVILGLESSEKEIMYSLEKGSISSLKDKSLEWERLCCRELSPILFDFTDDIQEWTLFVDVAPFNSNKPHGDYAFQFNTKKYGWVPYGQIQGFSDGIRPQYRNSNDSSDVMFLDYGKNGIYRATFSQDKWSTSEKAVDSARTESFSVASRTNQNGFSYYISFSPKEENIDEADLMLGSPKIYGSKWGGALLYKNLNDDSFRADELKVSINQSDEPVILFRKEIHKEWGTITLRDSLGNSRPKEQWILHSDEGLYSRKWNPSLNTWDNLGSTPIFDRDSFAVIMSGSDTVIKVDQGNIVSYLDGKVCDCNSKMHDIVLGPEGKNYVAYIGNMKTFESSVVDRDGTLLGKASSPYVVIKRLYGASEASLDRPIWAGPSQISGHPRYEGDILSWDGTNLHPVESAQSLKLAYDGENLYMAVAYRTAVEKKKEENDSSSATADINELALSVFKATFENNVSSDGVTYSKKLRWTPLKDMSVTVAAKGETLDESRIRVFRMKYNDAFEMEVRNGVPYVMFRNQANANKLSVVKFNGTRWLSVGNPAFAYPVQLPDAADLSVKSDGSPYVVYEQGLDRVNKNRKNKLVAMHYKKQNAVDLTMSALDFGKQIFNKECSFRQYLLNYSINVGFDSLIALTPTFNTPGNIARMEVFVNDSLISVNANPQSSVTRISLSSGLNQIELRVIGEDESELSYIINVRRKSHVVPKTLIVGNSFVVEGKLDSINSLSICENNRNVITGATCKDTLFVDLTHLNTGNGQKGGGSDSTGDLFDTLKAELHVESGWSIIYIDSTKPNDSLHSGNVDVPLVLGDSLINDIILINNENGDSVFVKFISEKDTSDVFKRSSSSAGNPNSSSSEQGVVSSSSSAFDEDLFYKIDESVSSSSSSISAESSGDAYSCDVECLTESSSSAISSNIPEELRAYTESRIYASGNIRIADNVLVEGSIFAGNRTEVGVESTISKNLVSKGDVVLANRSNAENIRLGGSLLAQNDATYGEVIYDNHLVSPVLRNYSITTGSQNITIGMGQTSNISAGTYGDFTARGHSTVSFSSGDYYFKSFWLDPNVSLIFEQGTRIWIAGGLNVGNSSSIMHMGNVGELFIYVGSQGYLSIGNNVQMKSVLYAPNASVQIYDHTTFEGFIWSANFNIEPHSILK